MDPGTLVVFEGLDATGKSTQLERFERACYAPQMGRKLIKPKPMFTHQPSGASGLGQEIYEMTEGIDWSEASPFTRQCLHLAAHTEHYQHDIIPALTKKPVWMDRCWWSTVAYGYRGAIQEQFTWEEWIRVTKVPTQGYIPHVVFLFLEKFAEEDGRADDERTLDNYYQLAEDYVDIVEFVPKDNVGEVTAFITGALNRRGLLKVEN